MSDVVRARPARCLAGLGLLLTAQLARAGAPAPEVSGPHGIQGYRSGHALFYTVPVDGGVVLVDTGFEEDGATLQAAVAGRPVLAILLTHGHTDHYAGAHTLGEVTTHAHARAIAQVRGRAPSKGWLPAVADRFLPRPTPPRQLQRAHDGECLELGGQRFCAIALPGHTPGSLGWVYRDVLFSGDALLGEGDGVGVAPRLFSDDDERARRSLLRLQGLVVATMLDGHSGRTDAFQDKLRAYLAARPLKGHQP